MTIDTQIIMTQSFSLKKPKQLKLGHINVFHINKKLHDISKLLDDNDIDIFGLSETKLIDSHVDNLLEIPTYSFFRRNKEKYGETGILVYFKSSLSPFIKRRTDLESFDIECIWMELKFPNNPPILICNMYRNGISDDTWYFKFADMLDHLKITNHEIFLLGDFNINLFDSHPFWETTISLYKLHQLIKSPTRVTSSTSTLIDHIYTNCLEKISNAHVSDSGISDHFPIFCTYLLKTPKPINTSHITIETRSFKNFNADSFLHDISECDFTYIYNFRDPDVALNIFYELFLPILDKHAPIIKKRIKHTIRPGWLTNEIIEQMNIRDKLSKNKKSSEYKKQRNKVLSLVRKAKKSYYNKMIESNQNIANLWRVTNQIIGRKISNQNTSYSNEYSAEDFNEYFSSLATHLIHTTYSSENTFEMSSKLKDFCDDKNIQETCKIPLLNEQDTFRYFKQLKNKKSFGTDYINIYFLKLALPFIVRPLTYIYNTSIHSGVFPSKLKEAKVIPLPKCKNASNLNDYRPISILNILSKPLEKHISNHIYDFIENNNLFHPYQSGFRKKHSCHTASIRLVDTWLQNINNNKINGAVFLDLKKAFDLVNHEILLEKISLYLQNDTITNLLKSYLNERIQTVCINGNMSSFKCIKHGVPQGSILGPLLFSLYINDLPLHISSPNTSLELFADDSSLHTASTDINDVNNTLQLSLHEIQNWCQNNKMILHPDKTKSMLITTRQKRQVNELKLNLTIKDLPIEQVKDHKVLGIIIDENLSWEKHITYLYKQLSSNLFLLSKLKPYLNSACLKLFFNAHILSRLNYSDTVWNVATDNHLKRLESLYRRGIKMISPEKHITTEQKIKNLNLLNLKDHFYFNSVCLTFKVLNNLAPKYLLDNLKFSNRSESINLIIPYIRINKYKQSFTFNAPKNWNSLPKEIRNIKTIGMFKNSVKRFLRSKS